MTSDKVRSARLRPASGFEAGGRNSGAERRAASAGRLRIGIANDELRAVQALAVIDLGTGEILETHRIYQQFDALVLNTGVTFLQYFVELKAVLQSGTTAALHEHAQHQLRISLARDELADLARGSVGKEQ
jgi:hypothetical protein